MISSVLQLVSDSQLLSQPIKPISDEQLSVNGLELRDNGRVLLIACRALAREVLEQIKANGWNRNEPNKIVPAVEALIKIQKTKYAEIFIIYTDCDTSIQLQNLYNKMGMPIISGPHCYSFYKVNANS
tara:strand:- start:568 stop:951 length:384 start_codon:yes stop_codon:yes gene_type:complete